VIRRFLSASFLATALASILIAIAVHPALATTVLGKPMPCTPYVVKAGVFDCPSNSTCPLSDPNCTKTVDFVTQAVACDCLPPVGFLNPIVPAN